MISPQTDAAGQPAEHKLHRGICPPRVTESAPNQRHFNGCVDPFDLGVENNKLEPSRIRINVIRFASDQTAQVQMRLWGGGAEMQAALDSAGLRELAARLLDAAHDIEQHPADTLNTKVTA